MCPSRILIFFGFLTSSFRGLRRVSAASQNGHFPIRTELYHVGCHRNWLDVLVNNFDFFGFSPSPNPPRCPVKGPGDLSKLTFPDPNKTVPHGVKRLGASVKYFDFFWIFYLILSLRSPLRGPGGLSKGTFPNRTEPYHMACHQKSLDVLVNNFDFFGLASAERRGPQRRECARRAPGEKRKKRRENSNRFTLKSGTLFLLNLNIALFCLNGFTMLFLLLNMKALSN